MTRIILPIIIITVVLVGGYFGYRQINQTVKKESTPTTIVTPSPNSTVQEFKTYQSKSMQFSIQIPTIFKIEDDMTSISLTSSTGAITITRNGTNFEDLDDYIKDFDFKRKLVSSSTQKIIIGGLESLVRIVKFPDEEIQQKSYYMYNENNVYILSTNSQSLYPTLDQIAQSFRYTP